MHFPYLALFPELRSEVRRHLDLVDRACLARVCRQTAADDPHVGRLHPALARVRDRAYALISTSVVTRLRCDKNWAWRRQRRRQVHRWLQSVDRRGLAHLPGCFRHCEFTLHLNVLPPVIIWIWRDDINWQYFGEDYELATGAVHDWAARTPLGPTPNVDMFDAFLTRQTRYRPPEWRPTRHSHIVEVDED